MKHASLSEIAKKLGVNKSKFAYYFSKGLLKPITKVGSMNVFDLNKTISVLKKIDAYKKAGKTLAEIKAKLK